MPQGSSAPSLTHLSLFSGIGGADLAAEWAGIRTIAHSEIDPHCVGVLEKNFPNTPNLGDIRTITKEVLEDATGRRSVTVISGGYPCQPFSVAGQRRGESDDRYLWPAMLGVIKSIRPPWVVGENVAGHISMGLDTTLSDLEAAGYAAQAFVLPACAKGALHRRDRVFVIAHDMRRRLMEVPFEDLAGAPWLPLGAQPPPSHHVGHVSHAHGIGRSTGGDNREERHLPCDLDRDDEEGEPERNRRQPRSCKACEVDADTDRIGLQADEGVQGRDRQALSLDCRRCWYLRDGGSWQSEPELRRMVDGTPSRLDRDRIKSLGNAIVPQQIYPIFEAIAAIEAAIANAPTSPVTN